MLRARTQKQAFPEIEMPVSPSSPRPSGTLLTQKSHPKADTARKDTQQTTASSTPIQARSAGWYSDSFTPAASASPTFALSVTGANLLKSLPDKVARSWNSLVSSVKSLQGTPLSPSQKAELKKVFGNSLDVDKLRIVQGNAQLLDITRPTPAITLGNRIIINPREKLPPRQELLIHEAVHAWQFQNAGVMYAPKALVAQHLGQGYDWKQGIQSGRAWNQLNPEQQADLIADAYRAGYFHKTPRSFVLDGVEVGNYLRNAVAQLRNGQGVSEGWT